MKDIIDTNTRVLIDNNPQILKGNNIFTLQMEAGLSNEDDALNYSIRAYCAKCFRIYNSTIENPISICTDCVTSLKFQCLNCDKTYRTLGVIKNHLDHYCQLRYSCDLCNYKSQNRSKLQAHIRNVHEPIVRYSCQLCPDIVCNNLESLSQHINSTHHKALSISCAHCDFRCSSKGSDLIKHMENQHPDLYTKKAYKCKNCGRCFSFLPQLKSHAKKRCSKK